MFKEIKISDYLYDLPDEKIAQFPLGERDLSKLLIYKNGKINETVFSEITNNIDSDSLIILNNTKVIPARLFFYKDTGAKIEIFCLEPVSNTNDYNAEFLKKGKAVWKCFVGNASKWKTGSIKNKFIINNLEFEITANILNRISDEYYIEFNWSDEITFGEVLEALGNTPLPPYIRRDSQILDKEKYQTVYAEVDGSVAAPTAGLHFTENVFDKLKQKKCKIDYLTLNVGAGTFKPVKSKTIGEHNMHSEFFCVSYDLLKNILHFRHDKIIAVGTTSMRALESVYWFGVKLLTSKSNEFSINQWYPYHIDENISYENSLNAVIEYMDKMRIKLLHGNTELMIVPGYKFRIADYLITNFHLPGSTLLLLIAAFIGEDWKKVYNYALENNFRFLSYGDSSLLIRNKSL